MVLDALGFIQKSGFDVYQSRYNLDCIKSMQVAMVISRLRKMAQSSLSEISLVYSGPGSGM